MVNPQLKSRPRDLAISDFSPQGHRRPESLLALFGNSIANCAFVRSAALDPPFGYHGGENSFAGRRQSLMMRPLGLHKLLQNIALPHVGELLAHFSAFAHAKRLRR
jgi:hypothetical protein